MTFRQVNPAGGASEPRAQASGDGGDFQFPIAGHPCELSGKSEIGNGKLAIGNRKGAVLLEVVLSLALFFISAGVIVGAMQASVRAAERVRLQSRANNLAITVQSWMDVGLVEAAEAPAEEFDSAPGWMWSVVAEPLDAGSSLKAPRQRVTIVIQRSDGGFRHEVSALVTVEGDGFGELDDWGHGEGGL